MKVSSQWLESARLVLRRIAPDDLPFVTRIHAPPEVAQHLYPRGRPRSETAARLQVILASGADGLEAFDTGEGLGAPLQKAT